MDDFFDVKVGVVDAMNDFFDVKVDVVDAMDDFLDVKNYFGNRTGEIFDQNFLPRKTPKSGDLVNFCAILLKYPIF
jgi:hypothetical protein